MLTDVARYCFLAKFLNGILLLRAIFDRVAGVFHVDLSIGFGSVVEQVHDVRVVKLHHHGHLQR